MRTSSLKCLLNKKYKATSEDMIGWNGSGRGTCREKVKQALIERGIDINHVVLDSDSSQSTNFYEESQVPEDEDLFEESQGPADEDLTPVENGHLTPIERKDSTRVEDGYLTPMKRNPLEDGYLTPMNHKDSTLVDDEDLTPMEDEELTPMEDEDSTPVQEDPVEDVQEYKIVEDEESTPVQEYKIGDNVLARWTKKEWYLSHVTHFHKGRYSVYFMDSNTKVNMSPGSLRPFICANPPPRRADMINKVFFDEGDEDFPAGRWKVRRIEGNEYICTRLTGGDGMTKNIENFDIGHVIRCYQGSRQTARELGPSTALVVSGTRRSKQ